MQKYQKTLQLIKYLSKVLLTYAAANFMVRKWLWDENVQK